ncbi:hypothetical protein FHS83_002340 [Rhizomicrobium palustre]|uniref:Uncharacterized protein n=1 Tax=Rhizomicrobium palustre TaxID=189966 RepID=A0A846N1B6_9PROT|nr:hypothetical protein [Rhizomicrobium palustre]NIK89022.1 hypothetical protein [Rhizomicrobium palustre]
MKNAPKKTKKTVPVSAAPKGAEKKPVVKAEPLPVDPLRNLLRGTYVHKVCG